MNIMNARLVQPNMTASLIVVIDACVLSAQCSKPVFTSCGRNSNRRGFPNPVNSLARLANGTSSPGGGEKLRMVQVQNRPQNVWVPRILHLSVTGCDPEDLEIELPQNDG